MAEVIDVLLRARMEASGVEAEVGRIQKSLKDLTLPKGVSDELEKSFSKLGPLLKDYQKQLNKGFSTQKDLKNFNLLKEKIDDVFGDIKTQIGQVNGQEIRLKADTQAITKLEKEMDNLQNKLSDKMGNIFKKGQTEAGIKSSIKELQNALNIKFDSGALKLPALSKLVPDISKAFNTKDFASFNNQLQNLQNRITQLSTGRKFDIAQQLGFKGAKDDIKGIEKTITDFFNKLQVNKTSANAIQHLREQIKGLESELGKTKADALNNALKELEGASGGIDQLKAALDGVQESSASAATSMLSMKDQVSQLQQSTQYFFSLRNMINLLKRGINEAVDVVKELDAAMTQTAVVTNFSVGDMWEKLPEYTANANALGASVKDMYEATTLYYQQGLDTDAAMGIANETMKMARIGGLEAADATDKMTAALRGFNMELNETSAQRVNDVYSNLAAKTASDTEELGTAMQRTASIAASAGMSFEGTAAFLAQAIETTREPAENLGTAMKTIVARFTELKKNPLEIAEVEGEEVDYNKVDTALKSIGVSLKDANGQFRDLDQVFLDISQRWDSLTQTQQRYVATTAAGSRQQSRFIAMMSNYERTLQLMDYANNSAGASNEQFGKTMESLEAKINKLKNAWDQFLMGIANDKAVKFAVDKLTSGLTAVNKIITTLSKIGPKSFEGINKSVLSIAAAFVGLKAAGKGINALISKAGGWVDPSTAMFSGQKITGNGQGARLYSTVTNPIIGAIKEVVAAINKEGATENKDKALPATLQQYKKAQSDLLKLTSLGGRMINGQTASLNPDSKMIQYSQVTGSLKGLNESQQRSLMASFPGLQTAMQASTIKMLKSTKLSKGALQAGTQITKSIVKGMNKGSISVEKGIELLRNPQQWGEYFGGQFSEGALKEITSSALGPEAFKQLVQQNKEAYIKANPQATNKDIIARQADFEKGAYRKIAQQGASLFNDDAFVYTKYDALADKIGTVGRGFATAGQSVQQFGVFLSSIGLEGAGAALTKIGTAVMSLGLAFDGTGKIIGKVTARIGEAAKAAKGLTGFAKAEAFGGSLLSGINPALLGVGVATAIITGLVIAKKHIEKKAQEAGEEVRKNFEEGFTKNDEKLSTIEGLKDRFSELSKGVDRFGHNASLTNEEYNEYLDISSQLAQLSPSLIAGYDAEGKAILKKGEALDEVIAKLKEEKQAALDSYITDNSINKLIKEFQTTDAYKDHKQVTSGKEGEVYAKSFEKELRALNKANSKANLNFDAKQAIEQLGGGQVKSLTDLSAEQMLFVSQHYNDILSLIEEKNGQLDSEVKEGFANAFGDIGGAISDIQEAGAPIIDAMQRWMGEHQLDAVGAGLGEEFATSFNDGMNAIMLKGLAAGWTSDQFKSNLRDYSNQWKNLGGATSKYSRILKDADKIQRDYLNSIGDDDAIDNYKENVEGLAQELEALGKAHEKSGEAGKAFAEQCQQQANALRTYATTGIKSVGEALNTMSNEFANARGAQERFEAAIEGGDYYTAAEQYQSIIDTVLDEKNNAGFGSLTAWRGATELLGEKFVDSAKDWQTVADQVERVKGMFADGAEGVSAFNDFLVEAWENAGGAEGALKDLGTVVDGGFEFNFDTANEDLTKFADLLGISESALAALIDKSRQWVPWDVSDPGMVAAALRQSETTMAGKSGTLYTSEGAFRQEAYQHEIVGENYTTTRDNLEANQNVKFLTVDNLVSKTEDKNGTLANKILSDIGISSAQQNNTLGNAVQAFSKMGFGLEDIQNILTKGGIELQEGEVTEEQVAEAYEEQAFAEINPTVAGIADKTGIIASNTSAMLAAMGIIGDDLRSTVKDYTDKDKVQDKVNDYVSASSAASSKTYNNLTGGISEWSAARDNMQAEIDGYNQTLAILEQSKKNATGDNKKEIEQMISDLTSSRDELKTALDNDAEAFANQVDRYSKTLADTYGKNDSDKDFLKNNAVAFDAALNTQNVDEGIAALKQLQEQGNLSHQTMSGLVTDFFQLNSASLQNLSDTELNSLLQGLNLTDEEILKIKASLNEPFTLKTQLTGEDLEAYINSLDFLTAKERKILLNAELKGKDKIDQFIDAINHDFGDGSEAKKKIIVEATAKMASGDSGGAFDLLKGAFGADKAEAITKKLSVIVDGSIDDGSELAKLLEGDEYKGIKIDVDSSGAVEGAEEATSAVDNVPDSHHTDLTGDSSSATGAAGAAQGATVSVPTNWQTLFMGDGNSAISAGASVKSSVSTVPTTWTTAFSQSGASDVVSWAKSIATAIFNIPSSKTVTVHHQSTGSIGHKRGRNYSIPAHQIPTFGAAAKGTDGAKKTSKRQITSLVGEEGFEIGYIPSEQRSMILGANGPEITSFPSDTVIYPHGISKDIIRRGKQNHKELNSFGQGKSGNLKQWANNWTGGSSSSNNSSSSNSSGDGDTQKQKEKNAKEEEKIIKKAGKITTWWENQERKLEAIRRAVEKGLKKVNKLLEQVGSTLKSVGSGGGNNYISKLKQQESLGQESLSRANKELTYLNKGTKTDSHVTKAQNKVTKAQNKVKKAKTKKAKKAAQEELKKAKQGLKEARSSYLGVDNGGSYADISYEVTKKTKDKNGKTKTSKETKQDTINLAGYIKYDSATQTYLVDEAKINRDAGSNKSKAEAIKDAANKEVNERIKRKYDAEDEIQKAQEALEELGQSLYETFFGWETELTKIWNVTQKIEESEARRARADSYTSLLDSQVASGEVSVVNPDGSLNTDYLDKVKTTFQKSVDEQVKSIGLTQESIKVQAEAIQKSLSSEDEKTTLQNVNSLLKGSKAIDDLYAQAADLRDQASASADSMAVAAADLKDAKADKKAANKAVKTAKKTKTKKDDKAAKKELNAANAAIKDATKVIAKAQADVTNLTAQAANAEAQAQALINSGIRHLDATETLAYETEQKQLEDQVKIIETAKKYIGTPKTNADGTISINFDTEAFEADKQAGNITSADAEKIQDYVKTIVEQSNDLQETYKTLTDKLTELRTQLVELKEAWVGYSDDLMSYLESQQQAELDKLKALNDSISNYFKQLIDKVKRSLELRRQQEDNAKTEQDITKKQQRLAALRANTAGGNSTEIARLEQEIADAQQGYQRTLEDQLLERMQQQADEAALQRERQIQIQEGIWSAVNNAATVNAWMNDPMAYQGAIAEAFFSAMNYDSVPLAKQEALDTQFNQLITGLNTNQTQQQTLIEAIQGTTAAVDIVDSSMNAVGKSIGTKEDKDVIGLIKEMFSHIDATTQAARDAANAAANRATQAAQAAQAAQQQSAQAVATGNYNRAFTTAVSGGTINASELNAVISAGGALGYDAGTVARALAATEALTWREIAAAAKKAGYGKTTVKAWAPNSTVLANALKDWNKYATGGLADYTGPAWLDGTPSKPELVLNAQDTKNFIALKDVLSRTMQVVNSNNDGAYGNTMYEININVDHLNNDYDVDKVAERVKKIIIKDSSYRNVTQVRKFR